MQLNKLAIDNLMCPRCEARPGDPCITITGNRARYPHGSRTDVLYDVWRDGYSEAERGAASFARSLAERGDTGPVIASKLERNAGV